MKANFYPQLTLDDQHRKVAAAGPLNWNEIESDVERLKIVAVVTQGGVHGRAISREYKRRDNDTEWWCEVEADNGGNFTPGTAPCAGTLYYTRPDGVTPWPWPDDPELVDP